MADNLIKDLGSWVILIICLGSLVDLFQFIWIVKRTYRKGKRALYNRIKREIQAEEKLKS